MARGEEYKEGAKAREPDIEEALEYLKNLVGDLSYLSESGLYQASARKVFAAFKEEAIGALSAIDANMEQTSDPIKQREHMVKVFDGLCNSAMEKRNLPAMSEQPVIALLSNILPNKLMMKIHRKLEKILNKLMPKSFKNDAMQKDLRNAGSGLGNQWNTLYTQYTSGPDRKRAHEPSQSDANPKHKNRRIK